MLGRMFGLRLQLGNALAAVALASIAIAARGADAPRSAPPSADCGKLALRSIERVMCKSPTLVALDAELNRVFALASRAASRPAAAGLDQDQSAWLARREACVASKTEETCLREAYVERIAAIRTDSAAARAADKQGRSLGPFTFRCEGATTPLAISYVNVPPNFAWVNVGNKGYFMRQLRSGSGARYEGDGTLFWEAQGEARWRPTTGSPETTCTRAATRSQ
jgi:uncharacterized protein